MDGARVVGEVFVGARNERLIGTYQLSPLHGFGGVGTNCPHDLSLPKNRTETSELSQSLGVVELPVPDAQIITTNPGCMDSRSRLSLDSI